VADSTPVLACGRFTLSLTRPLVVGILNLTPDSFSDGGRYLLPDAALAHAQRMVSDGADMIDIGAESTRPGASPVSEAEELQRAIPVVEALASLELPVSIDTRKPAVMRAAIAAGVSMVNDVYALRATGAIDSVASSSVAVCLVHMQGEPSSMQSAPTYTDVVGEVTAFLRERVRACLDGGVTKERIVLDPGFGFGKRVEHNLTLLRRLNEIAALGFPVLAGLSRKATIGRLTGREIGDRLGGSIGAAIAAVARGAAMVRVHDVRETVDALKLWNAAQVRGDDRSE
jgi:dihydropteroate synthase